MGCKGSKDKPKGEVGVTKVADTTEKKTSEKKAAEKKVEKINTDAKLEKSEPAVPGSRGPHGNGSVTEQKSKVEPTLPHGTPTVKNVPEDADVLLPAGNWVRTVGDNGLVFYYSEADNLYYHPPSSQFYDPDSEMWYDPDKDEWYKE